MSNMQFSVLNATQISNHPFNSSVSKQLYSFPKSPRFPKVKYECQHAYYTKPEVRGKRATSFGYGTKSDFTKTSVISPAPFAYEKRSDFDKGRAQKHGKTFGLGREELNQFGHVKPGPLKNPGVGNYHINRDLNKTAYSMRQRTSELFVPNFVKGALIKNDAPGPGHYEQEPGIKSNGKHFIAKYQSSGACMINPPSSARFPLQKQTSPGPQHYMADNPMNGKARYVLSQHRGQGTRAFSMDRRVPFTDRQSMGNIAPGPGTYRQPSDFGIYESPKKMNATQEMSRSSLKGTQQNGNKHYQTQPDLSQLKK